MPSYYRQQGVSRSKRVLHKLRHVALVILVAVLVGLGFLAYDVIKQTSSGDTPTQATTPVTSTIASNSEIYSSPYFQFQTSKKWRAIANESRDGHYVYRQYNGPLVEQELTVDINPISAEVLALVQTTRVLAARVSETGALQPEGGVSEHCKSVVKAGDKAQQLVKMNQVTFACNPDSTSYTVVIGLVGGTNDMNLVRPDGSKAIYRIKYQNVTAQPSPRDVDNIVETFETR